MSGDFSGKSPTPPNLFGERRKEIAGGFLRKSPLHPKTFLGKKLSTSARADFSFPQSKIRKPSGSKNAAFTRFFISRFHPLPRVCDNLIANLIGKLVVTLIDKLHARPSPCAAAKRL
jgi:hypothetical protein